MKRVALWLFGIVTLLSSGAGCCSCGGGLGGMLDGGCYNECVAYDDGCGFENSCCEPRGLFSGLKKSSGCKRCRRNQNPCAACGPGCVPCDQFNMGGCDPMMSGMSGGVISNGQINGGCATGNCNTVQPGTVIQGQVYEGEMGTYDATGFSTMMPGMDAPPAAGSPTPAGNNPPPAPGAGNKAP